MGKWHKYQQPNQNHPCTNCQVSWGNQSHRIVGGVDYFKSDTCDETCERLKNYTYQREEDLIQAALVRGQAGSDIEQTVGICEHPPTNSNKL